MSNCLQSLKIFETQLSFGVLKVLSISVGFTLTHQLSVEILPILKSSLFIGSYAEQCTPSSMGWDGTGFTVGMVSTTLLIYVLMHHILDASILFGAYYNLVILEVL